MKLIFSCPKCGDDISLDDCFKDKAAENELKSATIKCINQDCPWEGPGKFYKVQCINKMYSKIIVIILCINYECFA